MSRFRFLLALLFTSAVVGTVSLFFMGEKTALDINSDTSESQLDAIGDTGKSASLPAAPISSDNGTTAAESVFLEILPGDCQNECVSFSSEKEKERYCRNVCGLTAENKSATSTAPFQESIERKDAAIKNKDLGACSDIADTNLRKSCEVRVTEELLE